MSSLSGRTGVLLINLGTPEDCTPKAVRSYLAEFLMDKEVIDLPWLFRAILVHGIILRTRPKKSAKAYQKVWNSLTGSPLLHHSTVMTEKVQKELNRVSELRKNPSEYLVALGMRYGRPSISEALESLRRRGVNELRVLPLYPQYSRAATESSLKQVREVLSAMNWKLARLGFLRAFYDEPQFISAFAERVKQSIAGFSPDFVLFSYHGLPEGHIRKLSGAKEHGCLSNGCLSETMPAARFSCCELDFIKTVPDCYRAQCLRTTQALVRVLGLNEGKYATSFQSRLTQRWIKPFTDVYYESLPKVGVRKLLVVSPSFVADCLETLEEIAIRGREDFLRFGGEELKMVPSLNSEASWIQTLSSYIQEDQKLWNWEATSQV